MAMTGSGEIDQEIDFRRSRNLFADRISFGRHEINFRLGISQSYFLSKRGVVKHDGSPGHNNQDRPDLIDSIFTNLLLLLEELERG
jgi:hypothetical protein